MRQRQGRGIWGKNLASGDSGIGCNSEQAKPGASPRLAHTLGLFNATAIVIGSMIGSDIYIVDADIARYISLSMSSISIRERNCFAWIARIAVDARKEEARLYHRSHYARESLLGARIRFLQEIPHSQR